MPDLLLDRERAPVEVRAHAANCAECGKELRELEATMALMEAWEAPEISPYFDGKMAVRLREEQAASPAGWLERMRARLQFGNSMSLRPLAAAALALAVAVGGGMYAGFAGYGHQARPTPVQAASPVIQDLQSLDENAQVYQQLNSMEQDTSETSGAPNGNL
ncbi:MAG TPA: hypothetical protein VGG42_14865 [Acidobacteriaceae bacterium]|jgi:hypothetical protein